MSNAPAPRRIEWSGPEGWIVWADEDGCHVRTARGEGLEMPDVDRLFRLWSQARAAVSPGGQIEAPAPPTRDEVRAMTAARNEDYIRRRAIRAIESEFDTTDAPF